MGQEIVYCVRCASRIAGHDFDRDKAFRLEGKAYCAACMAALLPTLTLDQQKEVSLSSTKMKALKAHAPSGGSSVRMAAVPRAEAPAPPSKTPLLIACSIGAVVL